MNEEQATVTQEPLRYDLDKAALELAKAVDGTDEDEFMEIVRTALRIAFEAGKVGVTNG